MPTLQPRPPSPAPRPANPAPGDLAMVALERAIALLALGAVLVLAAAR
jgi:hypothetical protein